MTDRGDASRHARPTRRRPTGRWRIRRRDDDISCFESLDEFVAADLVEPVAVAEVVASEGVASWAVLGEQFEPVQVVPTAVAAVLSPCRCERPTPTSIVIATWRTPTSTRTATTITTTSTQTAPRFATAIPTGTQRSWHAHPRILDLHH